MSRRFFRHGELPLVLLALVDRAPRHRYEIMAELTRLFGPRYRASPGSVYPAIDALTTEGLLAAEPRDGRVVYRTTPAGQAALRDRAELLAALELRVGVRLREEDSLETLLTRFKARLAPLCGRVDPVAAAAILDHAATDIEGLASRRARKGRSRHAG